MKYYFKLTYGKEIEAKSREEAETLFWFVFEEDLTRGEIGHDNLSVETTS